MGGLLQSLEDPDFPSITYRRGASGSISTVLRGTGIRVQTIVIATEKSSVSEVAKDYDLTDAHVQDALDFYQVHRAEIDAHIQAEAALDPKDG